MTALERAKTMIRSLETNQLLAIWEMTTTWNGENVPILRGWLMDEFEQRYPDAFTAWMESEAPKDEDLRGYIEFETDPLGWAIKNAPAEGEKPNIVVVDPTQGDDTRTPWGGCAE